MKLNTKYLTFLFIFAITCTSFTKEDYLMRYAEFMDTTSENYKSFDQKDWEKTDKEYDKFNNEWYDRFRDELTRRERATIAGYKLRYNAIKRSQQLQGLYDDYLKDNVQSLRSQIEEYMDNKMEDDLNLFLEEARKTSKEVYEEALRIIDELQIEN